MTRDEAVKKLDEGRVVQYPGDFVDGLVALGLLKLDEPKSVDGVFIDTVMEWRSNPSNSVIELLRQLNSAGLKLEFK